MTDAVCLPALYRLLTFVSPAFPIGAFTYSHGLEQVIDEGGVACAADLSAWLEDILRFGAGRGDAILLKETWRAALAGSRETVEELRDLGLALQPSKERHLESSAQGTAFFSTPSQRAGRRRARPRQEPCSAPSRKATGSRGPIPLPWGWLPPHTPFPRRLP
ncbi:urease accessory UreF family protein [Roseibium salinum]|nr:urease accessory UreF family protein [Roseibium salinum]